MINIKEIADKADIIIDGYAFSKYKTGYRILNLNNTEKAAVFSKNDEVLETTMDDIEISIVQKYLLNAKKYMED